MGGGMSYTDIRLGEIKAAVMFASVCGIRTQPNKCLTSQGKKPVLREITELRYKNFLM
jgi:hypothetical protein